MKVLEKEWWSKMEEHKGVFRNYRNEINNMFIVDIQKCIKICLELLSKLHQYDINTLGIKYNMWFCYYTLGDAYYNLKDFTSSIKYIAKSFKFMEFDECKYRSLWIAAMSYNELGRCDVSIKIYDKCLEYYCLTQSKKNIAIILKNKAEILRDKNIILDAIEIYNQLDLNFEGVTQDVLDKYLDRAYILLIDLYIENNNYFMGKKYIRNIKDIKLKNKYCELISGRLLLA